MKAAIQNSILRQNGSLTVAGNANITIRDSDTNAIIELWGDRAGTEPHSNPFSSGADGSFLVYADAGRYNITAVAEGFEKTFFDVVVVADYYNKENILGTVSQSGGVPTGAIIERGSNANGEYVKFADGTMICQKIITDTGIDVTTSNYTILRNDTDNAPPAVFASTPAVYAAYRGGYAGEIISTTEGGSLSSFFTFLFLVKLIGADRTINPVVTITAIGRWY